jgi:hypothetical protein
MRQPEQRTIERYHLDRQPDADLILRTPGARYAIEFIKDISNAGISFYLNQNVDVSAKVAIEYADAKVKLEVYGRIAWTKTLPESDDASRRKGNYLIGVELISPMMLFAVLQKH